jgi:hypothetical protein
VPLFLFADRTLERRATGLERRLPELRGEPICVEACAHLRDRRGPVHATSFLRERRIAFDCTAAEFPRIFVHELFHFVWARAGNPLRWSYEKALAGEFRDRIRGELGWSAEWRKGALTARDLRRRTRRWREYCSESFCDTAAWLYSGVDGHDEFTLASRSRPVRRRWFQDELGPGPLSI